MNFVFVVMAHEDDCDARIICAHTKFENAQVHVVDADAAAQRIMCVDGVWHIQEPPESNPHDPHLGRCPTGYSVAVVSVRS